MTELIQNSSIIRRLIKSSETENLKTFSLSRATSSLCLPIGNTTSKIQPFRPIPATRTCRHCNALNIHRRGKWRLAKLLSFPFVVLICLLIVPTSVVAFVGANYICNKIPGLSPQQRIRCQSRPDAIVAVNEGAHKGLQECQRQFRHHKWNCSTQKERSIFGDDQKLATKEAAIHNAIRAAGVLHAIVTACGEGNLRDCGCDKSLRGYFPDESKSKWRRQNIMLEMSRRSMSLQTWKWGGCSIDLKHGIQYSKDFWDSREMRRDARGLMNLHNYEAGRYAVENNVKLECKCHGVSASCTTKTCWLTLPDFRKVGDTLKKSYERSRRVTVQTGRIRPMYLINLEKRGRSNKPRKHDLVYLVPSPEYCENDVISETQGTVGRTCNKTSTGVNSCDNMCCGRGYRTHHRVHKWDCKCKFFWCCHVKCKQCRENVEQYTCL